MVELNEQPEARPQPKGIAGLVRMRLWLALLTIGIVPLAIASALLYASIESQSLGQQLTARGTSVAAADGFVARIERVEAALVVLAADPALADLAAAPAADMGDLNADLIRRAREGLRAAASVVGPSMHSLWLVGDGGQPIAGFLGTTWIVGANGAPRAGGPPPAPQGPGARVDLVAFRAPTGEQRLAAFAPLPAGSGVRAALRLDLSLDAMLAESVGAQAASAIRTVVVASDGAVLAGHRSTGTTAAVAGEAVLDDVMPDTAGDRGRSLVALSEGSEQAIANYWSAGWVVAGAPVNAMNGGTDGWSLLVFTPLDANPFPVALVALAVVVGVILLLLTLWMSRQIVHPAEELEKSRGELQRLYDLARADSLRDPLTGLGNHRAFQEELDRQLEWFRRYRVPVALLVIDVDDLRLVNESEGHGAGDDVLREMGRLTGQIARYADRSFRIGGDKFALLMPHTDAEGALQLGQRLLERTTQPRAVGRAISFSAGVSACPALATTRSQLNAQAEAAMAWCKRHGRSTVDIFDPERDRDANQEATGELSSAVARVASQNLIRAAYQPIVDLATGIVIGFEGLTRPMPESGFADPSSLFAAAEGVGRSVELDHACIETIVRDAQGLTPQQLLSINVSPRFLEAPHFSPDWLLQVLTRHGIEATRVIVELTERENIEDVLRLQRSLGALQRVGIRIAADDVGAGNAGLRLLSQFRFDIVKLDLTLVQDGAQRDSSRAVLGSLRDLASRWGAYMVAEGLETVSQLRAVREIGVAAGQGYLLSRPMPTPALTRIDLGLIEAGGVVLSARSRLNGNDLAAAPVA